MFENFALHYEKGLVSLQQPGKNVDEFLITAIPNRYKFLETFLEVWPQQQLFHIEGKDNSYFIHDSTKYKYYSHSVPSRKIYLKSEGEKEAVSLIVPQDIVFAELQEVIILIKIFFQRVFINTEFTLYQQSKLWKTNNEQLETVSDWLYKTS